LDIILIGFALYASVVSVPFIFAVFGFKSSEKSVLHGMLAGAGVFCLFESNILGANFDIEASIPGVLANIIVLFSSHYFFDQRGGWSHDANSQKRSESANYFASFSIHRFLGKNLPVNENIYHLVGFISSFLVMVNAFSVSFSSDPGVNSSDAMVIISAVAWCMSSCFIIFPVLPAVFKNHKIMPPLWMLGVLGAMICAPSMFLIVSNFAPIQVIVFVINVLAVSFLFDWIAALLITVSGVALAGFLMQNYLVIDRMFEIQSVFAFVMLSIVLLALAKPKQKAHEMQEKLTKKLDDKNKDMSQAVYNLSIMKQEFLNDLNYEIRTPMLSIGAGAEAMHKNWDMYTPEQIKEFAAIVYHGYQNASKYIENLLDFAGLSSNKIDLKLEKHDFGRLIVGLVEEFEDLYLQETILPIDLVIREDFLHVYCDEQKIRKVIHSLLENALQYAEGGLVEIFVEKIELTGGKKVAKFSIKDSGVGIPEKELVHIFGPFVQSSATKKISGGKGIGLALCEKIILMHKGKIWAENNSGKNGATFTFILPLSL